MGIGGQRKGSVPCPLLPAGLHAVLPTAASVPSPGLQQSLPVAACTSQALHLASNHVASNQGTPGMAISASSTLCPPHSAAGGSTAARGASGAQEGV